MKAALAARCAASASTSSPSPAPTTTCTTIVRLGCQLSQRWYVGYERSLNATTGSWQLIYRIAQRFTLRAQSGDDNALDLIWQWRWNQGPLTLRQWVAKARRRPIKARFRRPHWRAGQRRNAE